MYAFLKGICIFIFGPFVSLIFLCVVFDMEMCELFVAIRGEFVVGILVRKTIFFFSHSESLFLYLLDVVSCENAFKVCAHMLFSYFWFIFHCLCGGSK